MSIKSETYLCLQGGDLYSVGDDESSHSFLNCHYIFEWNYHLLERVDAFKRIMKYIGDPTENVCVEANMAITQVHPTM